MSLKLFYSSVCICGCNLDSARSTMPVKYWYKLPQGPHLFLNLVSLALSSSHMRWAWTRCCRFLLDTVFDWLLAPDVIIQ